MPSQPYLARVGDDELLQRLASTGALVVEGPKACGKTAAARQSAVREVLLNVDDNARRAVAVAPSLVLDGPTSRLLDEWQVESATWNHVRRAVDTRGQAGQLILTGSAVPSDDVTRHMGAGRIARLRMRRMASSRVGTRRGPSPSAPCSGARGPESRVVPQGPRSRRADRGRRVAGPAQALQAVRDYLDEVRRADIARVDGTHRDPNNVGRVLRAMARNVATYVATTTLAADAGGSDGALARDTVTDYLAALDRLTVIEGQPAWAAHLRSRSILRGFPKRYFVGPSLAVAALRGSSDRLLADLNAMGLCQTGA